MSPTPLHRLAEGQRVALLARVAAQPSCEHLSSAVHDEIRTSVNMKPSMLAAFLRGEPRRNVFEWAAEQSARSGMSIDSILRDKLKVWYRRRLRFERRAGDGYHFHYAAMNIGGMGSPRYGRLCVVDRRLPAVTSPDPVWIAVDSLSGERLRDRSGRLVWRRLQAWVAPWDLGSALAALKLTSATSAAGALTHRVCNNDDYLEALSLHPLAVEDVQEIRSEKDDDLQARALDAILKGSTMGDDLDLALHAEVRDAAQARGIPWVQVDV